MWVIEALLRLLPGPDPKADFNGRGQKQQKQARRQQEAEQCVEALQSARRKTFGVVTIMKQTETIRHC